MADSDFDLGMTITGDGSSAVAAVNQVDSAIENLESDTTAAGNAAAQSEAGWQGLRTAFYEVSKAAKAAKDAQAQATIAARQHEAALRQARAGATQFGFQLQDVAVQLEMGTKWTTILSQQGGQMAMAFSMMGGAAGKVGTFFAGPFGTAIILATSLLGGLVGTLGDTKKALDLAKEGSDGLSDAQSVLGRMFDLTSGKIEHQNELLRLNARLTAINLRAEASAARANVKDTQAHVGEASILGSMSLAEMGQGAAQARTLMAAIKAGRVTPEQALQRSEGIDFSGLKIDRAKFQQALVDQVAAEAKDATASAIDKSLSSGVLDPSLRRDKKTRTKRTKKGPDPAILANFGEDAADRLDLLGQSFQDVPAQVEKVNRATAELDKILRDVERRKPPNLKELIAQGAQVRAAIQDGLQKPFQDFLEQQQNGLDVQRLLTKGHEDEADALQITVQLEKQMGPLLPQQKAAILAIVQARKAEERQLDIIRQKQAAYLDAIQGTKEAVRGLFDLSGKGLMDLPKRLGQTFEKLLGDVFFEKFFGQAFRELEDQVKGTTVVEDASTRMADAIATANNAIASLGNAASAAAVQLGGAAVPGSRIGDISALLDQLDPATAGKPPAPSADDGQAITVTGRRIMGRGVPTDPAGFMGFIVDKLLNGLHVFGEETSKKISSAVGSALEGAAIGSAAGGLVLGGKKGSKTGAAVGGALGEFAGKELGKALGSSLGSLGAAAGPLGAIAGGILGSVVGGLLKKTKTGSSTITDATSLGSLSGNDAGFKQQAAGLGGSVQSGLSQISQQLGATLGSFAVSIGLKDGKYRVDPTGHGNVKVKKGAIDFGDDQAGAVGYAIANAIADGALGNLSAAVQRALTKYGSDIDRGLQEAVKVQGVEDLLKDLGGTFDKTFRELETQLQERVRIAREYGFDMVKIEELNAKARADAFENAVKESVGSLQELLDNMRFGDLFEGTPMEQRAALIGKIADAKTDALAGKAGAGDKLAELERQLLGLSRSAFGTAGPEYQTDRSAVERDSQIVIDQVTAQARAAQDAATASLNAQTQQVQLQNETNSILSQQLTALQSISGALSYGGTSGIVGSAAASTARSVMLS